MRLWPWKTKPMFSRRKRRASSPAFPSPQAWRPPTRMVPDGGRLDQAHAQEQRAFARAARAEQRHELARLDRHAHVAQRVHGELARAEGLGEVLDLQDRAHAAERERGRRAQRVPDGHEARGEAAGEHHREGDRDLLGQQDQRAREAIAHQAHEPVGDDEAAERERGRLLEDHAHDHRVRRADQLERRDRLDLLDREHVDDERDDDDRDQHQQRAEEPEHRAHLLQPPLEHEVALLDAGVGAEVQPALDMAPHRVDVGAGLELHQHGVHGGRSRAASKRKELRRAPRPSSRRAPGASRSPRAPRRARGCPAGRALPARRAAKGRSAGFPPGRPPRG